MSYDYIVHIDAGRTHYLNNLTFNIISKELEKNPEISFFGRKHPFLNNIYEEYNKVKKGNKDDPFYIEKWKNKLNSENFLQIVPHMELCFFIRKLADNNLTKLFEKIYDNLIKYKLKRDQLLFCYQLQNSNFKNYVVFEKLNIK